ncbi:MAG: hypothetical protein JXR94_20930 [Candidatus Hydrogenedentes bacterium]|nr:hypothetical protein [Candidatus Hydrogenedentota bacterium]
MPKHVIAFMMVAALAVPLAAGASDALPDAPTPLERAAKVGLQKALTFLLETPATVDEVAFDRENGLLRLGGLRIANPKGFEAKPAIVVGEAYVEAGPNLLLAKEPVIRVVKLTDVTLNAEQSLAHGFNLEKLFDSVSRFGTPKRRERPQLGERKKLRIEKGALDGCTVKLTTEFLTRQAREWKLEPIEMDFRDEESGQGVPADRLLAKALGRLIQEFEKGPNAASAAPQSGATGLIDLLGEALK